MILKTLHSQKGAFSPFMFGLLMGMSIFSALVAQWGKQDLKRIEQERIERQQNQADDVRKALEYAILSENTADAANNYSANVDLGRARAYLGRSTGTSRSGSNVQLTERNSTNTQGLQHKRVIITTSEDTLLQGEIATLADADAISNFQAGNNQAVSVFDTEELRKQQIKQSREHLETEAAQIYAFWGANGTFPTAGQYTTLNTTTGLKDVWGQDFTYVFGGANNATLSFTTPWGYTISMTLDMN